VERDCDGPQSLGEAGCRSWDGSSAHAVAEVKPVAEVLDAEFAGEPLLDPDQTQVTEYLKAVSQ
jgi:hypothetical protein